MSRSATALLLTLLNLPATATETAPETETEVLYLSGTGSDDTVDWEFSIDRGRRAGSWATIPVPSQWELQGFGTYNYGHDKDKAREQGRYRHRFQVPGTWRGRTVDLVFEGVMTDTEVRLNGGLAGPKHQGGFYRFRHDVTGLLRFDRENLLEVTVDEHSSDSDVNEAEREADYWVFGGIFRPVYLRAVPAESIDRVAIDARHDGTLTVRADVRGLTAPARVEARVRSLEGEIVGEVPPASASPSPPASSLPLEALSVDLAGAVGDVRPWSAEDPYLYELEIRLVRDRDSVGRVLHRRVERFGFRTVEVRPDDGLHVNGLRVLLKGINRHSFWPDTGRALNADLNRRDVELMKSMNVNAVRMSHYPPDVDFLDTCDELGLYVIDELAGWHDAYGTALGEKLVREMVGRDVNHPSILLWANGNEGGWNEELDDEFPVHDLQRRPVIHPGEEFGGFDAEHYPTWKELRDRLDPTTWTNRWKSLWRDHLPLVLPTEFLHGLYDGGSAAGLQGYWDMIRGSRRGAGGFLWDFADEAVVRTDRDGALDTDGNHAPDGVLGPYRELSANYHAVRRIWSPVHIEERSLFELHGTIPIENRFDSADLSACRVAWAWIRLPPPGSSGGIEELDLGVLRAPPAAPGETGRLFVPHYQNLLSSDGVRLTVFGPDGRDLSTFTLPARTRRQQIAAWFPGEAEGEDRSAVAYEEAGDLVRLVSGTTEARFDRTTGELISIVRGVDALPLRGPRRADGTVPELEGMTFADGVLSVRYSSGMEWARWRFEPSGWLRLSYRYLSEDGRPFTGIGFELPEEEIDGLRWLGAGPGRVWGNRPGGELGVWSKKLADETSAEWAHEPKVKGFYHVTWAAVGDLVLVPSAPILGLLSPEFPVDARTTRTELPSLAITILDEAPSVGTKFHPARDLGPPPPSGPPTAHSGELLLGRW